MPVAPGPSRRFVLLLVSVSALLSFIFVASFRSQQIGTRSPNINAGIPAHHVETLTGHAIMPKLANETAKAELGRASWKLFHTVFARFPDTPTAEESTALQAYIHLFQRLYPCGECAEHFRQILDKFPPQVSSRSTAAAWGCHVHNEVNKSLNKELFDCSNIGDFYDCGCAGDDTAGKSATNAEGAERITGTSDRGVETEMLGEDTPLELKQEGYGRGG